MMTFSLHNSCPPNGAAEPIDFSGCDSHQACEPAREEFHLLREKLKIPNIEKIIERPRISALLRKSQDQFPATLVSGRAGTGKTALAASFALLYENVSWYSVESTDIEWPAFSQYFSASLSGTECGSLISADANVYEKDASKNEISRLMLKHFFHTDTIPTGESSLIVLDDIHHIFDAAWFGDFFHLLLYSLPAETHLLLLCRSKPPSPLWRLRSKQMLNVLDEKVLAFTLPETEALFDGIGLSASCAQKAHRQCFGRISKLLQFAEDLSAISTQL